jgi:hypothetical protein
MLGARLKQYIEMAVDVAVAFAAYYWLSWVGFALWVFFVMSRFCIQLISNQQVMMKTLLSRLPDRCAFCHREIVDEAGVFDEEGICHAKCSEMLFSLEEHRKIAGVSSRDAIHKPQPRSQTTK